MTGGPTPTTTSSDPSPSAARASVPGRIPTLALLAAASLGLGLLWLLVAALRFSEGAMVDGTWRYVAGDAWAFDLEAYVDDFNARVIGAYAAGTGSLTLPADAGVAALLDAVEDDVHVHRVVLEDGAVRDERRAVVVVEDAVHERLEPEVALLDRQVVAFVAVVVEDAREVDHVLFEVEELARIEHFLEVLLGLEAAVRAGMDVGEVEDRDDAGDLGQRLGIVAFGTGRRLAGQQEIEDSAQRVEIAPHVRPLLAGQQLRRLEISGDAVVRAASTLPFMTAMRLVVVRRAQALAARAAEALTAYARDPNPSTALLIGTEVPGRKGETPQKREVGDSPLLHGRNEFWVRLDFLLHRPELFVEPIRLDALEPVPRIQATLLHVDRGFVRIGPLAHDGEGDTREFLTPRPAPHHALVRLAQIDDGKSCLVIDMPRFLQDFQYGPVFLEAQWIERMLDVLCSHGGGANNQGESNRAAQARQNLIHSCGFGPVKTSSAHCVTSLAEIATMLHLQPQPEKGAMDNFAV